MAATTRPMKPITLKNEGEVRITRDESGILAVTATTEADLFYGQGYAQALDRGLQLLHLRILGRGQASEFLSSSEQMLAVDRFFRKMNLPGDTLNQAALVGAKARASAQAFCDGINAYFQRHKPWELRWLGYKPPEWRIEDSILALRVIGYVNMQLSQNALERMIIEMVQADISEEMLEDLFPGQLTGLDLPILRKIKLSGDHEHPDILAGVLPRNLASNNWVVAPRRSASGRAMLANDTHVESNLLPAAWQEMCLRLGEERYLAGACLPGFPGILNGRNNDLAWGGTYSHMDTVDSWVEECREGKFKRGTATKTEWVRFHERREIIRRRGRRPMEINFFENEHGVLEGLPQERGFYLTTRWAGSRDCGARSIEVALSMLRVSEVKHAMEQLGQFEIAMNWVFADSAGSIGYQMSGRLPRRRAGMTGLLPLPGWEARNDWKGFINYRNLPRKQNPREGYFVAAGSDLNRLGKARPINLSLAPYRTERIVQLLKQKNKLSAEDLVAIQRDLHSLQAERIMKLVLPHLPEGESADVLREWDFCYDLDSKGAALFEKLYFEIIAEILAATPGLRLSHFFRPEEAIFQDYFANFDNILFSRNSAWFRNRSREDCIQTAVQRTFEKLPVTSLREWKAQSQLRLTHVLFQRMPAFMGFGYGPVFLPGGRATPQQGQVQQGRYRKTGCMPAYRMLIDLAEPGLKTSIAGGPSDRRFSRWYLTDLENWTQGIYKEVSPTEREEPEENPEATTDTGE